jgi:acyl dehydratase
MVSYCVRARNTATDSENRMHSDETATRFGFRGGLVPGTAVYGYMTDRLDDAWSERGGMRVRFFEPFYEGDEVCVESDGATVSAKRADGVLCARGELFHPDAPVPDIPEAPMPEQRPQASAQSLAPGTVLGTLRTTLDIASPEKLLELSNRVLMANVVLGPWIHVSSEVRNFGAVRIGENVEVRSRVVDLFDRKQHGFVVLDVVVGTGERAIQHVTHTAIWRPREIAI